MPTDVILVVDLTFGDRLGALPAGVPVWIIDSPVNGPAAERARAARGDDSITVMSVRPGTDRVGGLVIGACNVEDHHGTASCPDAPYRRLVVHGATTDEWPADVHDELRFTSLVATPSGFVASR